MTKKQKIKKLKLPLNKMTGNEKDHIITLLEDINNNMKIFLDVFSGGVVVNKKPSSIKKNSPRLNSKSLE